ncbi:cupin domain-containing protein [Amycolatopsis endophytica]|uniref:Quercetin dioxygenase-like cupin family protein n=1 Tax=Amycolatopsis endophytica TaxID=860233 RepID=A0A853BCY5_9PSEU|nr:cupin domain-containing protein [Amycolatopsis endophytica]NYI93278.1 quercetin dioxygenase-like cupin family protein [Amycolatopsis endophytica]
MEISQATRLDAPAAWFTGTAEITAVPGPPTRLTVFHVRFEPGARTAWHRHPHGQLIYVTEGEGLIQRRGEPAEKIREGDSVWTGPGEWHWHGAAPGTGMTHVTLQETDEDGHAAYWGEQVRDEYPEV